jgi:uncharacterized protein YdeI (YjbR/CyaY-like superfamily)
MYFCHAHTPQYFYDIKSFNMPTSTTYQPLEFLAETRAQWRVWLLENHLSAKGVWLYFYKKNSGKPVLSYNEAVEEALCFGWIDSKPGTVDDITSKLYYSPRNPKSKWSALNKTRVEKLAAQGLIYPEGQRMIDLAKQTGTWDALNDVDNLLIPNDLQKALMAFSNATTNFEAFPRSVKKGILEWILNAKTSETRQKRIAETATLAEQNIRANQYVKK